MAANDEDDDEDRRSTRVHAVVGAAAGLAALAGGTWLIVQYISDDTPVRAPVQQIAVIRQPPPPPPPPPKPPEKPPEPPKIKEEVKIEEPKPAEPPPDNKPAEPPPAADKPLGVDADGSAGSDGFGLAANRGGRDLIGSGTGGGGGSLGRYYTGLLQRNFFEALARNRRLPTEEFSIVVTIWIGDDGRVRRSEVVRSSGDPGVDGLVQATLSEMSPLREVPPPGLRQVQLRLNRRA